MKSDKSQSMANLLTTKNKMKIKNGSPKIPISKISTVDEEEETELDIENKMKNLPHWKYGALFHTYMNELKVITKLQKEEFMRIFKKKDYTGLYEYL